MLLTPTIGQIAFLMAAFGYQNAQSMQTPFELQMEEARASFADYLSKTEAQLALLESTKNSTPKLLHGVLDRAATAYSNAAGYGNITPEERKFVDRFFANKSQQQKVLTHFLANHASYTAHIKRIFWNFQQRQKAGEQLDSTNLLIEVMHQETVQELKQPAQTTKVQMARKILEQKDGSYTISDEEYFRVVLVNLFSTHMFEKFFRG